jgi:hypothetical protein
MVVNYRKLFLKRNVLSEPLSLPPTPNIFTENNKRITRIK